VVGQPSDVTPRLRVAFLGTPSFAVPTLETLLRSPHRVVGVVTQPDRLRGRGRHQAEGAVKRLAREHSLPILQPERMQDLMCLDMLRNWRVDLGVVAAYGHILPRAWLEIPRFGMINVHASLLPKYRGAAPIHRAVMAGETETGITIIRLVRELDAGPMLGRHVHPIDSDQTSEDIEHDLAVLGARLLVSVVDDIAAGRAIDVPQDSAQATYAARLTKSEGLVDWTRSAQRIHDHIRGLHPWPHAFTYRDGARYIILRSRVESAEDLPTGWQTARPGAILTSAGDRLIVKAGEDTAVAILEIQPEGRRSLRVREFLSGYPLRPGQGFGGLPTKPEARSPKP